MQNLFTIADLLSHSKVCQCDFCKMLDLLKNSPEPEADFETWMKQIEYEQRQERLDSL